MLKLQSFVLFFYACVFSYPIVAQDNLIVNGDFEDLQANVNLKTTFKPSQILVGWREVAAGEVGYMHPQCGIYKPTQSPLGVQAPQSGQAYVFAKVAGVPFGQYGDINRYYLQTKLKTPLKANETYKLVFYVSFSDVVKVAIENIDVFFFDKPIQKMGDAPKTLYKPEESSRGNALDLLEMKASTKLKNKLGIITDSEGWVAIEHEFTAKGGEEFMVVGNFEIEGRLQKELFTDRKQQWNWQDSYYFFDNFSLVATNLSNNSSQTIAQFAQNNEVELQDVLFETNKATLHTTKVPQLDTLATVLAQNPSVEIMIEGHTDNQGDSLHNLQLSLERAIAVKDYLIQKGISPTRIKTVGFGSTIAILPNTTAKGRQRNRRVVIRKTRKK
jgi:OOP family OmpA-OmpF porin